MTTKDFKTLIKELRRGKIYKDLSTNLFEFKTIEHLEYPKYLAQNLYERNSKLTFKDNPQQTYKEFVDKFSPWIFAGFYDSEFKGIVYMYWEDNKCFINGFARRKQHKLIKEGLQAIAKYMIINYTLDAVYSRPSNKAAIFLLKQSGFEELDGTFKFTTED